jgi:hypothetical protein
MERKRIIRGSLAALKRYGIGFLPHALYTSGVADLHFTNEQEDEFGRGALADFVSPSSMAFVNADGTLRSGHDVFNEFSLPSQI